MPDYGIDLDIGYPNTTGDVNVKNFTEATTEVLAEIKNTVAEVEEAVVELKKIKTGTGLSIDVDLDEMVE